jgi:hypothetical protein
LLELFVVDGWLVIDRPVREKGKEDRRVRGRPRVRWIDNIRETLQEHQMTITEAARKAKTRSLYLPRHPKGYKRK